MVKIKHRDLDFERRTDILIGKGFRITEPAINNHDQKNKWGIQSPFFASDWTDENAFEERYSCKCGEIRGRIFLGEVCPKCKTKIEYKGVDLSVTGWIILDHNKVIQPSFYKIIEKVIGKDTLEDIINFNKKVGRDGELKLVDPKSEFSSIGLMEFEERFDEIIDKMKKKGKEDSIQLLKDNRDIIFTSSIPVYSSVLRPMSINGDKLSYTKIDKMYGPIFTNSKLLNDEVYYLKRRRKWDRKQKASMTVPNILYNIQTRFVQLWDLIFDEIDQKEGVIKQEILGGMLNFTARNVIVPDPSLKANEIRLCYMSMLELFKYEIIGVLIKLENIVPNKALEQWSKARVEFSPKIHQIMNYIIKKRKPRVLINRNPTINYGSLNCVKIVSVKINHSNDYTMSMPPQILPAMNADFDGDILNIIPLKFKELEKAAIKGFDPVRNMFISRIDGLLDSSFNLYKDQLIGLYQFNNI